MSTFTPLKKSTTSVLIIDDERPISIAVTDLLESYGYEAHYALNVEVGLEILRKNPFIDIVLLDYELGTGMNGLEAIPIIKEKRPHIQIIMLTSHDDVNLGVNCVKAGAFDYLTKPFDEERFFTLVPKAMEKKVLSQMNQLYLGILVHDMHNPLSNIKMGWEFFDQTAKELSLTPKHEKLLSAMEIGIWEIKTMIHNIISVSKFEQGHVSANQSNFNLKRGLKEYLENFEALTSLSNKSIELSFHLDEDFELNADQEFLKQVLVNLVSNSLRYCPEKQSVQINVTLLDTDEIQISVTNPGSFIEQSLRTQVFEKYFNGNFSTPYRGNKNYGLGLTYSRLAIEAMGGRVWIDSQEEPKETTFHFTVKNHQ